MTFPCGDFGARKRSQRGAGSAERRKQRRAIARVAEERQGAWSARSIGRDDRSARMPFKAKIEGLSDELAVLYAAKRQEDGTDGAHP